MVTALPLFNRLTQQQLTHPAQTLFDTCTYNYDSINQLIVRKNEGVSSHNINFEYNSLGQLIQQTLASSRTDTTTHYQWDSFGNPQSQTVKSSKSDADSSEQNTTNTDASSSIDLTRATHSEYSDLASNNLAPSNNADTVISNEGTNNTTINSATDADRLTHFGDSDFYYDEFGNQIRETGKGIKTRREYNAFNQLSCFNNGTLTQYDYDPLGRRIAKHTEHGKIDYIWDNDQLIGECQHGEYTWYINLPNQFHPVALIKQGEVYYYHLDQLNTPHFVTNNKAEVVWENQADVYGYEDPEADPDFNKVGSFAQPIRFQGQYLDEESGLHYNRYRYYSPKQQRFINQNPIGLVGGINHYQYAPTPVNWVDPFGLSCKEGRFSQIKEGLFKAMLIGAFVAGGLDATMQYALYKKVDPISVFTSAGGGGSIFANAAAIGRISSIKAIAYTASISGAANIGGTITSNTFNNKTTTLVEVTVAGITGFAGGTFSSKLSNLTAETLEKGFGGLNSAISSTTRSSMVGKTALAGQTAGYVEIFKFTGDSVLNYSQKEATVIFENNNISNTDTDIIQSNKEPGPEKTTASIESPESEKITAPIESPEPEKKTAPIESPDLEK